MLAAMHGHRILVTGASGFLGGYVVAALQRAGHVVTTTSRSGGDAAVDLLAPGMVDAVAEALEPTLVLHLAATARIADCERDPDRAQRTNAWLPGQFAQRFGPRLLMVSTDLVFDGRSAPYGELSPVAPLSVYGTSKAHGEELVRAHGGRVVRLPLLLGPDAKGRGATASLQLALAARETPPLFTNEYRTPLHVAMRRRRWPPPSSMLTARPSRICRVPSASRAGSSRGASASCTVSTCRSCARSSARTRSGRATCRWPELAGRPFARVDAGRRLDFLALHCPRRRAGR
jgi:hypothetical protein